MTNGQPNIVILGVGNVLMADEGVGVHAVTALENGYVWPEHVRCVDGGTSTHELLDDLEDIDRLIVLDAVRAGKTPGSMVRLEGSAVPSAFQTKLSPHQTGIADLLATLTFLGKGPKDVLLLGVEPVRLELDLNLSPEVEGRVAELGRQVLAELAALGITPKARVVA